MPVFAIKMFWSSEFQDSIVAGFRVRVVGFGVKL
jgi:hypothetical protein